MGLDHGHWAAVKDLQRRGAGRAAVSSCAGATLRVRCPMRCQPPALPVPAGRSPSVSNHHHCHEPTTPARLGKETALQKPRQYKRDEMGGVVLTRFSISVRANTYVLTLLFWCSNVYKRRVAWSDVCCSHRAVYKLLKLIWKVCGIDEGKGLLSGSQEIQNHEIPC